MRNKIPFVLATLVLAGAGCFGTANVTTAPPNPAPSTPAETGLKTYIDAKVGFTVQYPNDVTPIVDRAKMQLTGYIPACDPDHAIVCFPFGTSAYAGTNFESAAFAVHLRDDIKGQAACAAPGNGETAGGVTTINGTAFNIFAFGDSGAGHHLEGKNYRAWHNTDCIELSTRVGTTAFENWEPGSIKRFTADEQALLQAVLDGMLRSFRLAM